MILLVDALAARGGGLATHVENLVGAWPGAAPEDRVHVLVSPGSGLRLPEAVTVHEGPPATAGQAGRLVLQARLVRALSRRTGAEALLSTLPLLPRRPVRPCAVVVHDLRHETRPGDFPLAQRLARGVLYRRGYRTADRLVAISRTTRDELVRLHPRTEGRVVVVPHGSDHAERWRRPDAGRRGPALALAHFAHKDPGLVLETWARVLAADPAAPDLCLVGAGPAEAAALLRRTQEDARLRGRVQVLPRLDDARFGQVFAGASVLLFPSRSEGFGLPVLEGMRLDVPVVIGPEPALLEVAAGHAFAAEAFTPEALTEQVRRALVADAAHLAAARAHAAAYTWARAVSEVRAALLAPGALT